MRSRTWGVSFGKRTIVHIDMDAFFAQVEVLDHPEYRGKPLVVGGRRDSRRGVVSTASYEARKYGIRSAMPIQRAVQLCPHAIFVPPRMARYEEVSRRIFEVLETFSPLVEPLSIDEAFLDMTGTEHFYEDARHMGLELKRRIFEATSLTGSVGIAPNKFIAKLASDREKPDGLVIVPAADVDAFLTPLPVEALWGVGPKTAARLKSIGVHTVRDVRERPLSQLAQVVGPRLAAHVQALAFGRDERPVEPDIEAKSIGRETTFEEDVPDGPELRAVLARLAANVGWRLRKEGVFARTVTVKIRYPDFETHTKSRTLAEPFRDDDTLYREAARLLDEFRLRRPLRLLGVYASGLQHAAQTSLFGKREDRLSDVLDAINAKLGGRVVRRGRGL
ncbi:MAG: DNA polymerase IV, partial [Limnochordales bacterium]